MSAILLASASPASADDIVVEVYTRSKPPDADRFVTPVIAEVTRHGYTAGFDGVGSRYEQNVSRPASTAAGLPADFADKVERHHREWIVGSYKDAISGLRGVVAVANANAGLFAQNEKLRDVYRKALSALTFAEILAKDDHAVESTYELLRTFPLSTVSKAQYGSDLYEYVEARRKVLGASRGGIEIKPLSNAAVVFMDEEFIGVGPVAKNDLLPGPYRVYVQIEKNLSRVHKIVITPDSVAKIAIDGDYDRALHTGPDYTGLLFTSSQQRDRSEGTYSAHIAQELGAARVISVGIDIVHGHAAVVGALIDVKTGRDIRRASVPVEPNISNKRLTDLGAYLAGEAPTRGIDVLVGSNEVDVAPTSVSRAEHRDADGYTALEVTVGSIGLGGIAYAAAALHNDEVSRATGYGLIGASAVMFGVGAYYFLKRDLVGSRTQIVAAPAYGGGYVGVIGSF